MSPTIFVLDPFRHRRQSNQMSVFSFSSLLFDAIVDVAVEMSSFSLPKEQDHHEVVGWGRTKGENACWSASIPITHKYAKTATTKTATAYQTSTA